MYWIGWERGDALIRSAKMDGTNVTTLASMPGSWPTDITIDYQVSKWMEIIDYLRLAPPILCLFQISLVQVISISIFCLFLYLHVFRLVELCGWTPDTPSYFRCLARVMIGR